jgi:hypothetical protein
VVNLVVTADGARRNTGLALRQDGRHEARILRRDTVSYERFRHRPPTLDVGCADGGACRAGGFGIAVDRSPNRRAGAVRTRLGGPTLRLRPRWRRWQGIMS